MKSIQKFFRDATVHIYHYIIIDVDKSIVYLSIDDYSNYSTIVAVMYRV